MNQSLSEIIHPELSPASYLYGCAMFNYTGINAQCMTDEIKFELIIDGKVVATKYEYSVRKYADNVYKKDSTNAELITLLADMLVYGAEAQNKIGYKTTDLANNLAWVATKATQTYVAPTEITKEFGYNNSIQSAGLNISHVNKIYFRLVDDASNFTITLTVDGKAVNYTIDGDKVYTDDIKATEFDKVYTITVTNSAEETSVLSYNANAYIAAKDGVDDASTSTVVNIVKALNNYGKSAKAYVAANA